jgi:hypothetical protein
MHSMSVSSHDDAPTTLSVHFSYILVVRFGFAVAFLRTYCAWRQLFDSKIQNISTSLILTLRARKMRKHTKQNR